MRFSFRDFAKCIFAFALANQVTFKCHFGCSTERRIVCCQTAQNRHHILKFYKLCGNNLKTSNPFELQRIYKVCKTELVS